MPERTLRNWLTGLIAEGAIEFRGQLKGRRYRLKDRPVDEQRPFVQTIFTPKMI